VGFNTPLTSFEMFPRQCGVMSSGACNCVEQRLINDWSCCTYSPSPSYQKIK